jgi:hypothetical protein
MAEHSAEKNTGGKATPSFIERLLLKVGNEFTIRLWEHYEIGNAIKRRKKSIRILRNNEGQSDDDNRKYLLSQKALVQGLRERFFYLISFATEEERQRVAEALGIRANKLMSTGADYEKLIASAIGQN